MKDYLDGPDHDDINDTLLWGVFLLVAFTVGFLIGFALFY